MLELALQLLNQQVKFHSAAKARQMNQRVALNLQIQRLQGELQHIDTGLCR